jgi:GT2 family glycosyltransferase
MDSEITSSKSQPTSGQANRPPKTPTKVVVIIPTYNREGVLLETLESIQKCQFPLDLWQIILVDQTKQHTPTTQSYLEKLSQTLPQEHFRWFKPPQINFTSLTKARNFGLQNISKDYQVAIFIDDDVEVKPDFIQQHLAGYQETDKTVGATVGRVIVPGQKNPSLPKIYSIGGANWFGRFITNYHGTKTQEAEGFIGCNFSLKLDLLEELGLFDENFIGNALREDSDMAFRILELGQHIKFLPLAQVIHKQSPSGGTRSAQRLEWYYALFYNNFLFYTKHAPAWRIPFFVMQLWRPILACSFYYGKGKPAALAIPWRGMRDGIRIGRQSTFLPRQTKKFQVL